jgi:hypothetical protein
MRRITLLLPGAMGLVCAAYTGIYLVRWEWNRAIIAGVFFLAAEIIVASALVLDRLRRSEERLTALLEANAAAQDPFGVGEPLDPSAVALDALRRSAPEPPDRFAWLRDQSGQMNVFLPILLGAGVAASALAWAVEHLARATVSPAMERRLADRLQVLALPSQGLLGVPDVVAPRARRSWVALVGVVLLAVAVGASTALALDFVADRTQSRPDVRDPDARTTVDLALYGEIADRDPDRVLEHLWAVCTGPDVFRQRRLPPAVVDHLSSGLVHIVVDADVGANGAERLKGCLNDTTLDKVQARVVDLTVG